MITKRFASLRQTNQSGFSLLEVMFAMVILAVGMLSVLAALGFAIGANETSQEDMLARQIASEAMESIFNARNTSQLGFSAIANTTAVPTVTIGGQAAQVVFSGLAPGFVGLYQIDVIVPSGVVAGSQVPVIVSISGSGSPAATIAVR